MSILIPPFSSDLFFIDYICLAMSSMAEICNLSMNSIKSNLFVLIPNEERVERGTATCKIIILLSRSDEMYRAYGWSC